MADVIKLHPANDPDEVLKAAMGHYKSLAVIGWNSDGELDVRVDLAMTTAELNLILDAIKFDLQMGLRDEP